MISGILSPTHLIVVLLVALIVLGPKRLPGAGKALGQGIKEFKESITGIGHEDPPAHQLPSATAVVAAPSSSQSPDPAPVPAAAARETVSATTSRAA